MRLRYKGSKIKILFNINIKKKLKNKIKEICRADIFKSVLSSGNNHFTIIFTGLVMSDENVAIMGILVSWGNRFLLIFVSTLKQLIIHYLLI